MIKTTLRALAIATAIFAPAIGLAPGGGANAVEILGTSGPPIRIEAKEGRLIRLDRPAETVFIADTNIADVQVKTPQLIYIFGKLAGETTLYAVDDNDRVLLNRTVAVTHNLSQLRQSLSGLMPNQGVQVRSVDDSIVLSGRVTSAKAAEDARRLASTYTNNDKLVINELQIDAPQQVNLRVRIAEVARGTIKQLGINWDVVSDSGNFLFGIATGSATTVAGVPFFPLPRVATAGNAIATRRNNANNFFFNYNNDTFDINNVIDALDDQGLVKILAEPNLSALSGETASFLAGGEFPVPVPQENNVITITFKKFGVGLSFTPTLVGENRINLKVAPEVSALSNAGAINLQGFTVPALTVRRAETTVELGSGQSFAIAGLLQNDTNFNVRRVPGLADIPILGKLFTSENFTRNETELVILVTPYIVQPINERQIVAQADPEAQSNMNRIILGPQEGRLPAPEQPAAPKSAVPATGPARRLVGPAGFELQ